MRMDARRSTALAAAVLVLAVLLPITAASAAPADDTIRLQMVGGAGSFTYQDSDLNTGNLVQSFTASKQCAVVLAQGAPNLITLNREPASGSVGFSTKGLGVKVPGEGNSGKCEQVNVPDQKLKLKVGTHAAIAGRTFDFAELDIEAKFDAAINIRIFRGGDQVDASPSDDNTMDLVVTCTGSGSDCGPDDAARDNFRVRVPSGAGNLVSFDELWLWATATNTSGAVSLDGGADGTAPEVLGTAIGTTDTVFHIEPAPALSLTKLADDGNDDDSDASTSEDVAAGDQVGFTITVANAAGAGPAHGVSLTDTLPTDAGTSWTIESQTGSACAIDTGELSCSIAILAAGSSYSVHVTSPTTTDTILDSPIDNTASVSATNGGPSPVMATAGIEVWSGMIDCVDDETTEEVENQATATDPLLADITVTRGTNVGGVECSPKNYVIRTAEEIVDIDEVNVVTFLEDLDQSDQSSHYTMQVDWTYERRDPVDDPDANPATVGGRTFYIDYVGNGTFVPAELCPVVAYEEDGDPVPEMHQDVPWCITGQTYTIDELGNVVLQQQWDGLGDPRSY